MRVAMHWQTGAASPRARMHTPRLHLVRESGAVLTGVLIGDDGAPVDISGADASVVVCVRLTGAAVLTAQVTGTKLTGRLGINGYINTASPYNVAGAGGRFTLQVPASAFAAAGEYEAEVVYLADLVADPLVIYDLARIIVRDNLYGRSVGGGEVGLDTRPRFGLGAANAYLTPATLLAGMAPLTGGLNGGHAGTLSLTTTTGNYGWLAVEATNSSAGIHVYDGLGYGGWSGAGLVGNNSGESPDPSTSAVTYTDGDGTVWRLFRQDYADANPTAATYTVS